MKKSIYVKTKNTLHPGYGECLRCGGNWGWKKYTCHKISEHSSLFLFCVECDKIVTNKERWKALDEWKKDCIKQTLGDRDSLKDLMKAISDIEDTEFMEFPREKSSVG